MRSEEEFNLILNEAKKLPGAMESSCEGRQRKIPRWMNDGEIVLTQGLDVSVTTNNANTEQMRRSYYKAIDAILTSLKERFEQEDLSLLRTIEKILLNATKKRGVSLDGLSSSLVNNDVLKIQLDDFQQSLGSITLIKKDKDNRNNKYFNNC